MLTLDEVKKALPANLKTCATQSLTDKLNNAAQDPAIAEQIRNNFVDYAHILQSGRYRADDYLNAVKYVSYKLFKFTDKDAWIKTFPQRHANLVQQGASEKTISSYVSQYNGGQLVNKILEQTLVPTWILNQGLHQEAINTCATIMRDEDVSPKVRVEAATSLLAHLAKPKEAGPLINIDMSGTTQLDALKQSMATLVNQQLDAIENGTVTAKRIAAQPLIEGKVNG